MSTEKPSLKDRKDKDNKTSSCDPEKKPREHGGFENRAEPTRYGDWEVGGRCSDF